MVSNRTRRLRALRNFSRVITSSKMATSGVIILVVFSFLAVAAPLLTSYDPEYGGPVSGSLAPPVWYSVFGEGARLSQNLVLDQKTSFTTDPFSQGWQFSTPSPDNLKESFNSTYSFFRSGSGSIQITLDRSGQESGTTQLYTAVIQKTFSWTYEGPPARFQGDVAIRT